MTFLCSGTAAKKLTTVMTRNRTMVAGLSGVKARVMLMLIMLTANPRVIAFITNKDESRCLHALRRSSRMQAGNASDAPAIHPQERRRINF